MIRQGLFISLDFELFWGRHSNVEITQDLIRYYEQVHVIVPKIIDLFEKYKISCTWATVGLLAIDSIEEFNEYKPHIISTNEYRYPSNLERFINIYKTGKQGKWINASSLIVDISNTPLQEIGCHTFSHIFCNEKGINNQIISNDLIAFKRLFNEKFKINTQSLVFPYNQVPNLEELKLDFKYIRNSSHHPCYRNASINEYNKTYNRLFRYIDRYISLSDSFHFSPVKKGNYYLIHESRFLSINPKIMQYSFYKSVFNEMTFAAQNNLSYHLWWHPHNFCKNINASFSLLESILKHYRNLNDKYNFQSLKMSDVENFTY
jgi:hypothetical protein